MPARRLYYNLKPYLPWRFRMALRRIIARRKRNACQEVWPINEAAANPPTGWPGWPEGKQFALVFTHDVEGPDGLARCRQLMQLEMQMGFRSSFNFIPEGSYRVPRELREELQENGFEVGVQDLKHDGKLFQNRESFRRRARQINRYLHQWGAVGFRAGFMFHNLEWAHDLDIEYSSCTFDTDPFEPQPDGVGTIFPFWVPAGAAGSSMFDVGSAASADSGSRFTNHESHSGYIELPYTLPQDFTLFLLFQERQPDIWLNKLDWIAKYGGMVLLNTHPDYMAMEGKVGACNEFPVEFYKQFLDYVRVKYSGSYWHALPREVAAWAADQVNVSTVSIGRHNGSVSREPIRQPRLAPVYAVGSPEPAVVLAEPAASGNPPMKVLRQRQSRRQGLHGGRTVENDDFPRTKRNSLRGRRAAVLLFSVYPADPRPRRAAETLAREGVSVDVICLQGGQDESRREMVDGVNVLRIPLKRRRGGRLNYLFQYAAFISVSFVVLSWRSLSRRYDLVHAHNMPDVLVFSALVPKLLGAKVILDLHDPMPELMMTIFRLRQDSLAVRLLKRTEKWSTGFANLVLTVNQASKRLYSSRSCVPEKIRVVMNSPNEDVFRFRPPAHAAPEGKPGGNFTIMYHGSLLQRNGFDLAVKALETVRKSIPGATLTVCGEPTPFFESVMASVGQRGLQGAVNYLGMKKPEQIVEAIDRCDLGIIPNHRNIFTEMNTPTRIFEYLSRGKPVITPRARGIQDYFGDQELIYFELGDADDLARKIEYACFHPEEVREIVERGQKIYLTHRWSQESLGFVDTVAGLLGRG